MLPPILLLSLNIIVVITIGITPVHPLLITPVGPLLQQRSQSTTHVQPVGVYLTAAAMVYGQRPWGRLQISKTSHYITPPTEV